MSDEELKKKLRDAADSMEWGLHDEALDVLKDLRDEYGDHPEIMEKMEEARAHVDDDEDEGDRPAAPPPTPKEVQKQKTGDFEKPDTSPGFHFAPPKSPRFHSDEPAHQPPEDKTAPAASGRDDADSFVARRRAALTSKGPRPPATPGPEPSVQTGKQQVPLTGQETEKPPETTAPEPPAEQAAPAPPTMPEPQVTEELSLSDVEVVEVAGNPELSQSGKIDVRRKKPVRTMTPAAVIVDLDAIEYETKEDSAAAEPAAEPEAKAKQTGKAEPEPAAEPEAAAAPEAATAPDEAAEAEAAEVEVEMEVDEEPEKPVSVTPSASPPAAEKGKGRVWVGLGVLVIVAGSIGGAYYYFKGPKKGTTADARDKSAAAPSDAPETPAGSNENAQPETPDTPATDKPPARESETPPARAEPETPKKDEPPRPTKVRLKLTIKPARARPVVSFRGKKYWGSKFQSPPLKPVSSSEKVLVAAKGYEKVVLTLTMAEDVNRTVILTPVPKVAEAMKARARARARVRARARARRARKGRRRKKPTSRLIGLD